MLRGSQIVGDHAKEKCSDQHCRDECEHTNYIHGVFPRDGINICVGFNLIREQTAGISAGSRAISAETRSSAPMERGAAITAAHRLRNP
jgi:hypothetical protein